MVVKMDVTIPQALALQAMFAHWNRLAGMGASREVAFYADGDGNFHPNCEVSYSEELGFTKEEWDELHQLARVYYEDSGKDRFNEPMALFDFDSIAWRISVNYEAQGKNTRR